MQRRKNKIKSRRAKLVVHRPIWRCGRRRVDLTGVFDVLVGGREAAERRCSITARKEMRKGPERMLKPNKAGFIYSS